MRSEERGSPFLRNRDQALPAIQAERREAPDVRSAGPGDDRDHESVGQ